MFANLYNQNCDDDYCNLKALELVIYEIMWYKLIEYEHMWLCLLWPF